MNQTKNKSASISKANTDGKRSEDSENKAKNERHKANKVFYWVLSIIIGVFPMLFCLFLAWFHESDASVAGKYSAYVSDFINGGSFLWVSITILAMSLFELLLYGFRDDVPEKNKFVCTCFVVIAILMSFAGGAIYLSNIGNPVDPDRMKLISWALFALYVISSGIVSFFVVQEV